MSAPWLRILKRRQEFGFQSGPTIPFLLGALRKPIGASATSEEDKEALRELLTEMRDSLPAEEAVAIKWCDTINALVVAQRVPALRKQIRIESPTDATRALHHEEIEGVDDFASLVEVLWNRHKEPLASRTFSRDQDSQAWRAFREWEKQRIKEALAAD